MSVKRREAFVRGQATIKINGKTLNLYFAKQVYRCAECLSPLRYRNSGLACSENDEHRGFIHREEAEAIRARQEANVEKLSSVYEIVDGKVVVRDGNQGTD